MTKAPVLVNLKKLAERVKATSNKPIQPPNEETEDEESEERLNNIVTDFSPVKKVVMSSLPMYNSSKNPTQPQSYPCNTFEGVLQNTSQPPDPNGGVGFEYVMGTTNNTIRIQDKSGVEISTFQLSDFYSALGNTYTQNIFDPKISYDPFAHRWIFVCAANGRSSNSAFLLAVSETPDPNGGWTQWAIDADGANSLWLDYPQIGFNKNWITISSNMFTLPTPTVNSVFSKSRVFVLDKNAIYAGNSINVNAYDLSNYFTVSPCTSYDPLENNMWALSNFNSNTGGNGFLKLFTISGTGVNPSFTINNSIQVGTAWAASGVDGPQLGTAVKVDLGDHRIQNTCYRNGALWSVQSIFLPATSPTYVGIQAVNINPFNSGSHVETRRIANSNGSVMSAYPSVTVNKDNDVGISYITFYPTNYPSCAVSFKRGSGLFESYVYKTGEDWYSNSFGMPIPRNRFGDYTSIFVDPEDDKTMWAFSEFSSDDGGSPGTGSWGTWWAKICPDFCSNDLTLNATNGNNFLKKYEVNNTIISSSLIYPGANIKYDAGTKVTLSPGFKAFQGSKVNVYIEGCGGVR